MTPAEEEVEAANQRQEGPALRPGCCVPDGWLAGWRTIYPVDVGWRGCVGTQE